MPPKKGPDKMSKISIVRFIYLYLISAITFIIFVIGAVSIVDQGLKSFVFGVTEYDYYERPVMVNCDMYLKIDDESSKQAYDECLKNQELYVNQQEKSSFTDESKRRLSIGVAQVLVAFPFWLFHWKIIERDRRRKRSE